MKKFFRLAVILALPVFLAACATKSGFEPYAVTAKETTDLQPKTYQLTKVALKLGGDTATPRYPDQAALEKRFFDELQVALKQQSLEGRRYELQVSVNWGRRLIGGSDSSEPRDIFSSAVCQFESNILEKGVVLATDAGDPLNANSLVYDQKNFLNNLKRIKDSISRSGDPESEVRELKRCVELLVERLPR